MTQLILTRDEMRSLQRLSVRIATDFDSVEDPDFLREAAVLAHEMPRRLRAALSEFRLGEPDAGLLMVSGYPVDDEQLGPTPAHWRRPAGERSPTLEHETLLVLLSSLLGEGIGWSTQQDGRVVHDVLPIQGMENEQIGTGSEQTIWWHTEDAFHPLCGDYVGLMCLRNFDRVPTTFASLDGVRLGEEDWDALFEPLYTIRPDNSHKVSAGGELASGGLARYSRIEEMQQAPEKISILSGDPSSPYIRIDPYFMDPPAEPRARQALSALIEAIDRKLRDVVLESGDVCFIDNFKAVHGRRAFRARYDGRDRWLKRINITRDMRKSRACRATVASRVIQ
jgi:Fe(II)/alpha-ketoglutarate-dependent arginine beta-hydroxylase